MTSKRMTNLFFIIYNNMIIIMFKILMFTYICTKLKDADMYQNIYNIKNYIRYMKKIFIIYYI